MYSLRQSIARALTFRRYLFAAICSIGIGVSIAYPALAAGETYSLYGINRAAGSTIQVNGGLIRKGSEALSLQKASPAGAFPNEAYYQGRVIIDDGKGGTCSASIAIRTATPPPATDGQTTSIKTIYATENPGTISNPGSTPTPGCKGSYSSSLGEFNRSGISVVPKSGNAPTVESEANRNLVVTVYSDKALSEVNNYNAAEATVKRQPGNSEQKKKLSWNNSASTGSIAFSNIDAGKYQVCIKPSILPSTASCKTVTKAANKQLSVTFGDASKAHNVEGSTVTVTINSQLKEFTGTKDVPAIKININSSNNVTIVSGTTDSASIGGDTGVTPAQTWTRSIGIDGVTPAGTFRACVEGLKDKCTEFKKVDNKPAAVTIDLTEAEFFSLFDISTTVPCGISGGLGWIICPVVRFLAGVTDAAYEYVTAMLTIPASILFNPDMAAGSSLYKPWSIMRNIANAAFVIAFLIIIYSQITSMGVSNYGIKKMLPRLIIAALLVNTSFWIAGIAVDLSNVVGESVYKVFGGFNIYNEPGAAATSSTWTTLADTILLGGAGVAAGTAVVTGLLSVSVFLPMILAASLAILVTVIILTIRQALIIGLIVIAPLAFVAYLLPNTEGWFKRWWSVFKTLLMLFPVIAFIFGVSKLASAVLTEVATVAYKDNDMLRIVMEIMAAGVQILPLFLTAILTNVTQGVLGKVTGIVNNKEKGLIDRSKKMRSERQAYRWNQAKDGRGRFGKSKGGIFNPARSIGRAGRYLDDRGRTRKANMEASENNMEGAWRGTKSIAGGVFGGGGEQAIQRQDASKDALETIKVAADIQNIKVNQDVKADLAVEKIKLEGANADFSSAISKELAENTSERGKAGSAALANKYVSEISKSNSDRMSQEANAKNLAGSAALQAAAAGADARYGAPRASAAAKQTLDKLHDERVAAEKSALSDRDNDELLQIANDGTKSVETRAAAAGLISGGNHRASQNKLWKTMQREMKAANFAGNATEVDALQTLQKQVMHDMKEKPFGVSDRALGQAKIGRYGLESQKIDPVTELPMVDASGNPVMELLPDFDDNYAERLATKTNAQVLSNFNPDDASKALKLVQTGKLSTTQQTALKKNIDSAFNDKQHRGSMKGDVAARLKQIHALLP